MQPPSLAPLNRAQWMVIALVVAPCVSSYHHDNVRLLELPRFAGSAIMSAAKRGPAFSEQDDASQRARVRAHDYSCIADGQVFVATSWLSEELLVALRADVRGLLSEGSTVHDTDEPIGKRLKVELRTQKWTAPGESEPSAARSAARRLFDTLRKELEGVLDRRLLMDRMGAQAKFTIGKAGEPIHLHMDSRHEAFADSAFEFDASSTTRRSVAWLLYLSDDGWDEPGGSGSGGQLRAYPRRDSAAKCGSHRGNMQVGWIERGRGSEAVFLDSWVTPSWMGTRTLADVRSEMAREYDDEGELWSALYTQVQPSHVLYCVGADGQREDVSAAHEAPLAGAEGGAPAGHIPSLREMLPEGLRAGFSSTICAAHPKQQLVQVSPKGGTLVVFETAVVPHEATRVVAGQRIALFGFFAEERQVPRAWADPAGSASACGPWFYDSWAYLDDEVDIYEVVRRE